MNTIPKEDLPQTRAETQAPIEARLDMRLPFGFLNHFKTLKLIDLVGFEGPHRFQQLGAALGQNPSKRATGDLFGLSDLDIEDEAGWTGKPGAFASALVACGFLDGPQEGERRVHDWHVWQPHLAERTAADGAEEAIEGRADMRLPFLFFTHRKIRGLVRRLGFEAAFRLQQLWAFVGQHPTRRAMGSLENMSDRDIEIAAQWQGERGAFTAALVDLGLLDGCEESRVCHDWEVWQPYLAKANARSAQARKAALARWGQAHVHNGPQLAVVPSESGAVKVQADAHPHSSNAPLEASNADSKLSIAPSYLPTFQPSNPPETRARARAPSGASGKGFYQRRRVEPDDPYNIGKPRDGETLQEWCDRYGREIAKAKELGLDVEKMLEGPFGEKVCV